MRKLHDGHKNRLKTVVGQIAAGSQHNRRFPQEQPCGTEETVSGFRALAQGYGDDGSNGVLFGRHNNPRSKRQKAIHEHRVKSKEDGVHDRRFINADLVLGEIGNVRGSNLFACAFNNPIMYEDPTGHWPKLSHIFAVVGVAVVAAAVATAGMAAPALAVAGGGVISAGTAGTAITGSMIVASGIEQILMIQCQVEFLA